MSVLEDYQYACFKPNTNPSSDKNYARTFSTGMLFGNADDICCCRSKEKHVSISKLSAPKTNGLTQRNSLSGKSVGATSIQQ